MTRKPKTLRSRIVFYFCGYLAVLLIVYSAGISGMLKISEDLAFNRQLSEIAGRIARQLKNMEKFPSPLPRCKFQHTWTFPRPAKSEGICGSPQPRCFRGCG
jgi:hypothetical protein